MGKKSLLVGIALVLTSLPVIAFGAQDDSDGGLTCFSQDDRAWLSSFRRSKELFVDLRKAQERFDAIRQKVNCQQSIIAERKKGDLVAVRCPLPPAIPHLMNPAHSSTIAHLPLWIQVTYLMARRAIGR